MDKMMIPYKKFIEILKSAHKRYTEFQSTFFNFKTRKKFSCVMSERTGMWDKKTAITRPTLMRYRKTM